MKAAYELHSQEISADLIPGGSPNSYRMTIGDWTISVEVLEAKGGRLDLLVDGGRVTAYVTSETGKRWVTVNGQTLLLTKSTPGSRRKGAGQHHAAGELTAPMPGLVRAVNISEGDTVTKGQTLLLLEAMKMEIRVQATRDGVVKKLFVEPGQTVEKDQPLVEIGDLPEH